MAYEISEDIKEEYKKDEYKFLRFKLSQWRNIQRIRKIIRIFKKPFYKKKTNANYENFLNLNISDYDEIRKFYQTNSFCFIQNIFDQNFYQNLIKNLPNKEFFVPPRHVSKQYNFGFKWVSDDPVFKEVDFYHFDEIRFLYHKLKNNDFSIWLSKFLNTGQKHNLKLYSFIASLAEENSILFCHKDSISNMKEKTSLEKKESAINMIFFIKGKDNEENSGATGIYETNNFTKPIFVPKVLNNSLLIYKSDANFFHGFDKMKKNSYRFTINAQFAA